MVNSITMTSDRDKGTSAHEELTVDSDLRDVIEIIVNDFNGDTMAYFNSIRPDWPSEEEEAEESEARLARQFVKSI